MSELKTYKSNYWQRVLKGEYNPLRPNVISVTSHFIEYKKRNWHLISVDTQTFHFQNVVGIDVDKHLFGATLRIVTSGSDKILVSGFSKRTANAIKLACTQYISLNSQRTTTESLANAISTAVGNVKSSPQLSVADELKKLKGLLDSGILSEAEYQQQKSNLLSQK